MNGKTIVEMLPDLMKANGRRAEDETSSLCGREIISNSPLISTLFDVIDITTLKLRT